MIANAAFTASLVLFALLAWLAAELRFLAPYKVALFQLHGRDIAMMIAIVFGNLCAIFYCLARWVFLRETGRKLIHMDRQLLTSHGVHEDVPPHLWSTRR